jgi:hypothetical protein
MEISISVDFAQGDNKVLSPFVQLEVLTAPPAVA